MRLRKREQNDKQHILERLTVYAKESYSMLRGDILLVNNNTEKTAQQLSTIINNISESDEAFEESVESVISFKKEITQYLKSNYADSLNHLSSENSYESTTDTTISMELQIIRSMLEKLIEEKKEKDNSDNLIVDSLCAKNSEKINRCNQNQTRCSTYCPYTVSFNKFCQKIPYQERQCSRCNTLKTNRNPYQSNHYNFHYSQYC